MIFDNFSLVNLNAYRLFLIFFLFSFSLVSQTADSTKKKIDPPIVVLHSPKKAAIMSAILPGLGQVYNKKYWKPPVLYIGFAALGYAVAYNNKLYRSYRDAYIERVDNDPTTIDIKYQKVYTDANLVTLQDYYHRYRDLAFVGCTVLYVLNIIDASVDAHLFYFDVSDNLSLQISPFTYPVLSGNTVVNGISLKARF